jgi:hypothetical protein
MEQSKRKNTARVARPRPKTIAHPTIVACSPLEMNRALVLLSRAQVRVLADLSGIPFTTLYARTGSRDMLLSTASMVAQHLPLVRRLKLPEKGDYQLWLRKQRIAAVAAARLEKDE